MIFQLQCRGKTRGSTRGKERHYGDDNTVRRGVKAANAAERTFEEIFVRSLVAASSCKRCIQSQAVVSRTIGTKRPCIKPDVGDKAQQRPLHTASRHQQSAAVAVPSEPEDPITRKDYEDLVNTYDSPSDLWEVPRHRHTGQNLLPYRQSPVQWRPPDPPPQKRKWLPFGQAAEEPVTTDPLDSSPLQEHVPLAPRLVMTPEQEEEDRQREIKTNRIVLPPEDEEHAAQIRKLKHLAHRRHVGTKSRQIWAAFSELQHKPRLRYIQTPTVHRLFLHLAWVEHRTKDSSEQYFSFLEEAIREGYKVTTEEWNTAVAFAGRWAKKVRSEEVKSAVEVWMRMENEGRRPDDVTFNILFDVAARAGRFALAGVVINELKARGLPLTRYYYTQRIFMAGLKRDGEGVRLAFREMVNAGEIIDTAVMNCVILGLCRSGEVGSAESVFDKMRTLHAAKNESAVPRNWHERRKLGRKLRDTAIALRKEKEKHESSFFGSQYSNTGRKEAAQKLAPIHPDFRTCRILLIHHCQVTGDLMRVHEMMYEMRKPECGGRVPGGVYVVIFHAFWKWGDPAYTAWNLQALEGFWRDFLVAVENGESEAAPLVSKSGKENRNRIELSYSAFVAPGDGRKAEAGYTPFRSDGDADWAEPSDMDGSDTSSLSEAEQNGLPAEVTPLQGGSSPDIVREDHDQASSSIWRRPRRRDSDFEVPIPDLSSGSWPSGEDEDDIAQEDRPPFFSAILCERAIYAFYKCAGTKRVLRLWKQIQEKWPEMKGWERDRIQRAVHRVRTDDYTR